MSTGSEVQPGAMKIRLHQFLSKTGVFASKRAVKDAIWAGDVTVNGSVVKDIAFQFKPNKKEVCYCGQRLSIPSTERCFVLNKPKGVVCSRLNSQEREFGKQSVFELFRPHLPDHDFERLITVGRLDEDTTGLLLVTTDGTLAHRIASPDHHGGAVADCRLSQRKAGDRHAEFRILCALACLVGLTVPILGFNPVEAQIVTQIGGVFVLPLSIAAMTVLVNRRDLMGTHRAGAILNLGLATSFLFSVYISYTGCIAIGEKLSRLLSEG